MTRLTCSKEGVPVVSSQRARARSSGMTNRGIVLALIASLAFVACARTAMIPGDPPSFALPERVGAHKPAFRALCPTAAPGHFRCFALQRTDVWFAKPPVYRRMRGVALGDLAAAASSGWFHPLEPKQLQQAYGLPSTTAGKGQTVGIVDAYDDPTAESDMAAYRKAFKLPPCTTANGCFQKLNERGATSPLPSPNPSWAGEISIDLDMASAICPNCHIVLVEATTNGDTDLGKSVKIAYKAGARQISNSYGTGECYYDSNVQKDVCRSPRPYAKYYNIPGAIVTASSGDCGWYCGAQAPADFTTVISVGGTSMYPYGNKRGWIEFAWNGSGSGCSIYVTIPSWIPKSTGCPDRQGKNPGTMRPIADISAVADIYTGVLVYQTYPNAKGGFTSMGGTSVASPIIASVYALAGNASSQRYGAKLYAAPAGSLNDVIFGRNTLPDPSFKNIAGQYCTPVVICNAVPGWDGPSGNGTPWGVKAF